MKFTITANITNIWEGGGIERAKEAHGLFQKCKPLKAFLIYWLFFKPLCGEKEALRTENANKDSIEVRTIDSEFRSSNLPLPLR